MNHENQNYPLTPKGERVVAGAKKVGVAAAVGVAVVTGANAFGDGDQANDAMQQVTNGRNVAVCEGSHEYTAKAGDTWGKIILSEVTTDPADNLKTGEATNLIAHAVAAHQKDFSAASPEVTDHFNVSYQQPNTDAASHLEAGQTVIVPNVCERPE